MSQISRFRGQALEYPWSILAYNGSVPFTVVWIRHPLCHGSWWCLSMVVPRSYHLVSIGSNGRWNGRRRVKPTIGFYTCVLLLHRMEEWTEDRMEDEGWNRRMVYRIRPITFRKYLKNLAPKQKTHAQKANMNQRHTKMVPGKIIIRVDVIKCSHQMEK